MSQILYRIFICTCKLLNVSDISELFTFLGRLEEVAKIKLNLIVLYFLGYNRACVLLFWNICLQFISCKMTFESQIILLPMTKLLYIPKNAVYFSRTPDINWFMNTNIDEIYIKGEGNNFQLVYNCAYITIKFCKWLLYLVNVSVEVRHVYIFHSVHVSRKLICCWNVLSYCRLNEYK